jgi:hypothetical protein
VAKLTQRNRKVVLQSVERLSAKEDPDLKAYQKQLQEEADRDLERQLLGTDSYDFGEHFNQIEDYQEQRHR